LAGAFSSVSREPIRTIGSGSEQPVSHQVNIFSRVGRDGSGVILTICEQPHAPLSTMAMLFQLYLMALVMVLVTAGLFVLSAQSADLARGYAPLPGRPRALPRAPHKDGRLTIVVGVDLRAGRRWRALDQTSAFADPVDVAVTMHHDGAVVDALFAEGLDRRSGSPSCYLFPPIVFRTCSGILNAVEPRQADLLIYTSCLEQLQSGVLINVQNAPNDFTTVKQR
jgi:hypothetical protein